MTHVLRALIGLQAALGCTLANAGCASPVAPQNQADRSQWRDLESHIASSQLNPLIQTIQHIASHGAGTSLNNDFYAITIDAANDTPATLARFLRINLDRLVFAGSNYSFNAYDQANGARWSSAQPLGSVMSFTLVSLGPAVSAALPVFVPSEVRASVVMSCDSSNGWIFSTIQTEKDGWHPVSGNRAFGVDRNADGSLTVWTKGADRAVNSGPLGAIHQTFPQARDQTYAQGHQVWVRLLNNLTERLKDRNPRLRTEFSIRRPFP